MVTPSEWLAGHCRRDHDWLLSRLRSLDNCLDQISYYGEVCSDLRGFGGLRRRCQELQETLRQHIPEEEEMFAALKDQQQLRPLLLRLVEEHRIIHRELGATLEVLDALVNGDLLPEDLFTLQDRVRAFSATLQEHINTENESVLPLLQTA